jgi:hypothetical protein
VGVVDSGTDFFSVHCEVHNHDPTSIRLHLEAPQYRLSPELHDLKELLINALLISSIEAEAEGGGLKTRKRRRISAE